MHTYITMTIYTHHICVYMCVCIYIYIYTYIHTYVCVYIYVYIYIYKSLKHFSEDVPRPSGRRPGQRQGPLPGRKNPADLSRQQLTNDIDDTTITTTITTTNDDDNDNNNNDNSSNDSLPYSLLPWIRHTDVRGPFSITHFFVRFICLVSGIWVMKGNPLYMEIHYKGKSATRGNPL